MNTKKRNLKSLIIISLILIQLSLIQCGHITFIDFWSDFSNDGLVKQLFLTFQLENPLQTSGYLRVKLPFSVSVPSGATCGWTSMQATTCAIPAPLTTLPCTILEPLAGDTVYWINNFLNALNVAQVLDTTTWYTLVITASTVITIPSGTLNPIELYTTSSNAINYIIYDSNPVFTTVDFIASQVTTITNWVENTPQAMGTVYSMNFNIIPTLENSQKIVVELVNSEFKFVSPVVCTSSNLAVADFSCTMISLNKLAIDINPGQLNVTISYNFQTSIQMPNQYLVTAVKFYLMQRHTYFVIEYQTIAGLSTAQLSLTTQQLFLGWGLKLTGAASSNIYGLYRNDANNYVYNTLKFQLQPAQTLIDLNYKVTLQIGVNVNILTNSIIHNFVNYGLNSVQCSVPQVAANAVSYIECKNVLRLVATTSYYISVKVSFLSTFGDFLGDGANFGILSINPMINGQYVSQSTILTANSYAKTGVMIKNNIDRIVRTNSVYDNQAVHTKGVQAAAISTDGSGVKYKGLTTYQTLAFISGTTSSDFSIVGLTGFTTTSGVDIYTGKSLIQPKLAYTYTSSDCYGQTAVYTKASQTNVCLIQSINELTTSTLNLRFGVTDIVAAQNLFTYDKQFGFDNIQVMKFTSIYADDALDFYIGLVQQNLDGTSLSSATTYTNTLLVNSYIVNAPNDLANIQFSIGNFWTESTTTGFGLTGNEFPAFIRLFGYFVGSEKAPTSKIGVFFDHLNTFPDPNNINNVACSSTVLGTTCSKVEGNKDADHWLFINRVIVNIDVSSIDSTLPLQIIIPVSTYPGKRTIKIRVVSLSLLGSLNFVSAEKKFAFVLPASQNLQQFNNINGYVQLSGQNYSVNSYNNIAGSTATTKLTVYHTDQTSGGTLNFNDATNFGASIVYVTKWNFYVSQSFSVSPATMISTAKDKICLTFSYKYLPDTAYPIRYGLHCPLQGAVGIKDDSFFQINSFTYPSISGIMMANPYSCVSDKLGNLVKYQIDSSANMLPNTLIMEANPISIDLYYGQKSLKPALTFSCPNPIPQNFIFKIVAQDKLNFNFDNRLNVYNLCRLYDVNKQIIPLQANQGCYQVFQGDKLLVYFQLLNAQLPAGNYTVQLGGIDALNSPVTYQNIVLQIASYQGYIINQSPTIPLYFNFQQNFMSLTVTNPQFLIKNSQARSIFSLQINLQSRQIYQDEKIVLDLDVLNPDNTNILSPICVIKDISGDLSQLWQSCTFDAVLRFRQVTLTPKSDILTANHSYVLELHQIKAPISTNTGTINAYLQNYISSNILTQLGINIPARVSSQIMDFTQLFLQQKLYNAKGQLSSLQFTIKPKVKSLNVNSQIIIYFPSYYPLKFGIVKPFCQINSIYTRCEFQNQNILSVIDIPLNITAQQTFTLQISGLPVPYYTSVQNFFVGLDDDTDMSQLVEFGEVADVSIQLSSLNKLVVSNFYRSNVAWIVLNSYTIQIIPQQSISANFILTLDFNSQWVEISQKKEPISCLFQDSNPANPQLVTTCVQQGHQISMEISIALTAFNKYTLIIQNFRNPHTTDCIPQGIIVSAISKTTKLVIARSYLNYLNINNLNFVFDSLSNVQWKWKQISFSSTVYNQTQINSINNQILLHRGTYTRKMRISLANDKRVDRDVNISITPSLNNLIYFNLYPQSPVISTGQYYVDVRIGVLRNVTQGVYPIYFTITQQGGDFYDIPPGFLITVDKTAQIINPTGLASVVVPIGGYSLPVYYNFDDYPPYSKMIIESSIPIFPDLRLDFGAVSDYKISVENPRQFVYLKSDDTPVVDDRITYLNYDLQSLDTPYYKFNKQKDQIQVVDRASFVSLKLSSLTKASVTSTSALYQVQTTNIGNLYYQINLVRSQLTQDFNFTKQQFFKNYQYNFFDTNQLQYGLVPITVANQQVYFVISNLLANNNYTITFWLEDLQFVVQATKQESFTTADNSDFLFKIILQSKQIYKNEHLIKLACRLCSLFQYPYQNVRSELEVICDPKIETTVDYSLITPQASQTVQNYYFYFYPFNNMDLVQRNGIYFEANDLKLQQNIDQFLSTLNTAMIVQQIVLQQFIFSGKCSVYPPVFANPGTATSTSTQIVVSGQSLYNNGLIWAIVEKLEISIKGKVQYVDDPTFVQVRAGLNSSNNVAYGKGFQIYNNIPLTFTFNNLIPSSHYRVVFIATSEDPSGYKYISPINAIETDTLSSQYSSIILANISLILCLLIFIFA